MARTHKGVAGLTDLEIRALYDACQFAVSRMSGRGGSTLRAMTKLDNELRDRRRAAIRAKGYRDQNRGVLDPTYKGGTLGSFERITYDAGRKACRERKQRRADGQ